MPGSSFGQAFRVTTAGESHGPANVVIIDGCPPGLSLELSDIRAELRRRRPGQSSIATARAEGDEPEIVSGVVDGKTAGTSIAILIRNRDARSHDYDAVREVYRPGHADYSYDAKYGVRDPRGGGRASARETVARVAAGAVAKKLLGVAFGGEVLGWVRSVGPIDSNIDSESVTAKLVDELPDGTPNIVRCPDHAIAARMIEAIEAARADGDSLGGVAELVVRNVPAGLGEPVFDKLKADLAKAIFSIPAVLGVEFGSGFAGALLRGSEHNDAFVARAGRPTATNRHGGILGGISTGMPISMRVAVKAPSSISRSQSSIDATGAPVTIQVQGRHDPCVLPRFVPVAEAMVALVLADHFLRWRGQCAKFD